MIQNNIVFNNPTVPQGYYFMKLVGIEAEPVGSHFPKLLITLEPLCSYELPKEALFRTILHPTPKSFFHYQNFFWTYFVGMPINDFEGAMGRWGCVEIYRSVFEDIEYSAVRFCYQPIRIRVQAARLMKDEMVAGAQK